MPCTWLIPHSDHSQELALRTVMNASTQVAEARDREILLDRGYKARCFFKQDANMIKMGQKLQYGRKHRLHPVLLLRAPEMRNSEASAARPQAQAFPSK